MTFGRAVEAQVGVEVLGPAAVVVAHLGAGWDEARAAGSDAVRHAAHLDHSFVAVEVQLPQVGKQEHVLKRRDPVHSDTHVGHGRRLAQEEHDLMHGVKNYQ